VGSLLQLPLGLLAKYEIHPWIVAVEDEPISLAEEQLVAVRGAIDPVAWLRLFLCAAGGCQIRDCRDWEGAFDALVVGEGLLAVDRIRTEGLEVTSSPTLFIRNRKYDGPLDPTSLKWVLCHGARGIADRVCADLPACLHDDDCCRAGSVGACENSPGEDPRCVFQEAPPVAAIIVGDSTAVAPLQEELAGVARQLFPGIDLREIDVHSGEAQQWITDAGILYLPALLLQVPPQGAIADIFMERPGGWLLNPAVSGADIDCRRVRVPGRLDVLIPPQGEDVEAILQGVVLAMEMSGAEAEVHILPLLPDALIEDSPLWRRCAEWWVVDQGGVDAWRAYLGRATQDDGVAMESDRAAVDGLRELEEWLSGLEATRDRPLFLVENHEVVRLAHANDLWRLLSQLKGRG
jgi:hypothetical protein